MTTTVRAVGATDVGRSRERNEDAYFTGRTVFAVADGLGGHRAGEVASELAMESIRELDEDPPKKAASHIAEAVRKSNRAVHAQAATDPELKGMGTTLTAVAIHEGVAHLAHVGDSRAYLIRGSTITQMSSDHTLVARMVADGKLTPEQAESHPQRSVLTRALGAERDVQVQSQNMVLSTGDRILLCSDGLSAVIADAEVRSMATPSVPAEDAVRNLIDEANARGGPDNITVVIIDVIEAPAQRAKGVATEREMPGPRIPRRAVIWTGVLTFALIAGALSFRTWTQNSFYVGEEDGKVTIFRGVPGVPLSSDVEEPTDLEVEDIGSPAIRRSLEQGIRADSLEEARRIIEEQIEPNVGGRRPRVPIEPPDGP